MNLLYITLTQFEKLSRGGPELQRLLSFRKKFDYIKVVCRGSGLSLNFDGLSIEGFPLSYFTLHCKTVKYKFDYVMASSLSVDGLIATSLGIPSTIRCGGEYNYRNPIKNLVSKGIQSLVLRRLNNLVVNSEYLKDKLGRGTVVHNGVDLTLFKKRKKAPKFSCKGLYLGRIRKDKGSDIIKRVNKETDFNIDCISGESHSDVPKIMAKYDFLILPSRSFSSESLPNVLLEAMAVGVPCIASNIAGISEILYNGVLFKENDFDNLKSLLNLLKLENFRNILVEEGFKVAKAHDIKNKNKELVRELFK